jgi:hypothetical protein
VDLTYNVIITAGSGSLNNSSTSAGLFTINGSTSNPYGISNLKLGSQYDFTLNRPGTNGGATLGANATINGTAKVSNGDVNYGNYVVTISSTGKISETYGNSFIGSNGGYLVTTRNLGSLSFNNIAGLGAVVNTSTSMGNTVIKRYTPNNITPTGSGHSIKRMWLFSPSTNTGLNADIRLTYDDNSTDNLIGGNSNSGMRIFTSSNGVSWTNNGTVGFSGSAGTLRSVNSTNTSKLNASEYLTAYDPANTISFNHVDEFGS